MKIAIVGCGNIGKIYARTFLKYNLVSTEDLFLLENNTKTKEELINAGFKNFLSNDLSLIKACDLILLAVKPQDFNSTAEMLKPNIHKDQIFLSVMAGVTLNRIEKLLNCNSVVRAMPNSPIQLGLGMTAYCATENVDPKKLRMIEQLLSSTGRTLYFEKEDQMDAVTALSGSGPAYVFYFIKNMIEAGEKMGFTQAESTMMVNQTVLGAFHLMNSSTYSLDDLIKMVASKGGTTEAALTVFSNSGLAENLQKGIFAAHKRGHELANA